VYLAIRGKTVILTSKKARCLWLAAATLCIVGLLAWLWASQIWDQYYDYLPRSPNTTTGNIYYLNIHGRVVYETLKERSRRENWDFWAMAVFCSGMALGGIHTWIMGRRQGR